MKYDAYHYLWPPRPEKAIPPELIGFYARRGWCGQIKKNGTCTVIFSHGDEVIFKTRHDDDHKAWVPVESSGDPFRGREQWNVYVAELLHSKVSGIRNHLYLFDILVSDGEHLTGMTFADRQAILAKRFPGVAENSLGAIHVGTNLSRARCYAAADLVRVWGSTAAIRVENEGIVLKDPAAKLLACVTQIANAPWQVKCRLPSAKYSF